MKKIISIASIIMLIGCAGAGFVPVVDRPGANYRQDLAECQAHATEVMSAGESAVVGAVGGALFGGLLAVVGGGSSDFVNGMAAVGAATGAIGEAAGADRNQRSIISRCLYGRGYSVLN